MNIIRLSRRRVEEMNIDGRTEIYGIIGWPLGHTRSPALHNAAFGQMGMNAAYVPMPVAPGGLRAAVEGVRALGIKGLNVTVPHKVEVAQYLDRVEGVAAELGAVNVIVNRDGELVGHNTDVEGFRLSMEKSGAKVEGAEVAVLGAGGAARSVIRALLDAGAGRIHLFNRTLSNAQQTAGALGGADAGIDVRAFSDAEVDTTIADCSIIINATSAGLRADDEPPVNPALIRRGQLVVDLIYEPWKTRLLEAAETAGAATANGYGMLVFQAFEAFRLWTGCTPPLDAMWEAGLREGLNG